jgi:type IV pilus assembly protein PilE
MQLQLRKCAEGFTLIELMVVVVIVTILMSIAIPAYMSNVRQSRRTEAKTAILDLAGREETYFSTNGSTYGTTPASLGYIGAWPVTTGSGYYQVTVCSPAVAACAGVAIPNPPAAPSYQVVAIPLGSQVRDTQCTAFGVDSTGQQYASGTGGSASCWSN